MSAFNSLYEILFLLKLYLLRFQYFQFSLWDSKPVAGLVNVVAQYLSILFMRFLHQDHRIGRPAGHLSILFMRFYVFHALE